MEFGGEIGGAARCGSGVIFTLDSLLQKLIAHRPDETMDRRPIGISRKPSQ
jgi:hypothetical protein